MQSFLLWLQVLGCGTAGLPVCADPPVLPGLPGPHLHQHTCAHLYQHHHRWMICCSVCLTRYVTPTSTSTSASMNFHYFLFFHFYNFINIIPFLGNFGNAFPENSCHSTKRYPTYQDSLFICHAVMMYWGFHYEFCQGSGELALLFFNFQVPRDFKFNVCGRRHMGPTACQPTMD